MTHVVTRACCGDASCVFACPVNAIHPTPDEADFGLAEMLYIDPVACVDCGACVGACPVGAIAPDTNLTEAQLPFVDVNALFHAEPRTYPAQAPVAPVRALHRDMLRVAIVGAGPAALYAADELLKRPGVEVDVYDRLPTPYGLVRAGVAPDHAETRTIDRLFRQIEDQPGFRYSLGVEIGRDLSHADLLEHHHAVVYATGASSDRRLDIPGEDQPGSTTATDFVAWYNGHPDHRDDVVALDTERVVVVGNGNVALDVARVLATDPELLATTDVADDALRVLRASAVREIVVLGRRDAVHAAFTLPELLALVARDDIDVVVEGSDLSLAVDDPLDARKLAVLRETAGRPRRPGRRRIVLRFTTSPVEVLGSGAVEGVRVRRNEVVDGRAVPTDETDTIETGLVLRSIGYRGVALSGLPFDETAGVVPHDAGRVEASPRTYVAGWIKRGPRGFIGTNKSCAQETVDSLVADANAGLLDAPLRSRRELAALVESRVPDRVDLAGWRRIDRRELAAGAAEGRPRRRITSRDALVQASADPADQPSPRPDPPRRRRARPAFVRRKDPRRARVDLG